MVTNYLFKSSYAKSAESDRSLWWRNHGFENFHAYNRIVTPVKEDYDNGVLRMMPWKEGKGRRREGAIRGKQ
jgi:hypothetical protein